MLQFPFPVKCDFAEAVKVPGEKQLLNFPIPLLPNTKMIILILDISKPKKFFLHVFMSLSLTLLKIKHPH